MDDEHPSGSSGFGRLLREYRLSAGLSQEALAERARMSSHGVSALERGYRRSPHRDTLALLAEALDLNDEQRGAFELAIVRPQVVRRGGKAAEQQWPFESRDGGTIARITARVDELRRPGNRAA